MANITDIAKTILEKMDEQGMSMTDIAKATMLDYNTVKDFLQNNRVSKLDTIQRIIRALGYEFSEIIDDERNVLYLSDEDNADIRKYRRLNAYYKGLIKQNVDAYLLLQENDKKKGIDRGNN